MRGLRTRFVNKYGIAAVGAMLILVGAGMANPSAQGQPGTVTGIPFADLSAKLDAKLDAILEALNAEPAAGPVVLSTGISHVVLGNAVMCALVNVGTETITDVQIRIVNAIGQQVSSYPVINEVLPGRASAPQSSGTAIQGFLRCEFEYEGFAADVRANMVVLAASNATPLVALDAR